MKHNIYTVRDAKTQAFSMPMTFINEDVMIRMMLDVDPEHPWRRHHEDFSIWHVGTFDDDLGLIYQADTMRLVTNFSVIYGHLGNPDAD